MLEVLRRHRLALLGAAVTAGLVLVAVFASLIAPYGAEQCTLSSELAAPSRAHLLGADPDGCDILSRIFFGARISLVVGVTVVSVSCFIGSLVGSLAGYYGRGIDRALMFVLECFQAFPGILLAITVTAMFEQRSVGLVILALCVAGWVGYARLVRGQVLLVREEEYVQAAIAMGEPTWRILLVHIMPNIAGPVIVQATFGMAGAILAEAGLSFLGLGAPPGSASWGAMLNQGRSYMLSAPHLSIFPGIAIMITVLGFNFLGDGLRDALDPKEHARR